MHNRILQMKTESEMNETMSCKCFNNLDTCISDDGDGPFVLLSYLNVLHAMYFNPHWRNSALAKVIPANKNTVIMKCE